METSIRTTNWKNMNFFRRTVTKESFDECLKRVKHLEKILIVAKRLKKFDYLALNKSIVVISSRGMGKTTRHRLATEAFLLKELETALISKDREKIKASINRRINFHGGVYERNHR